jgi:uncharacterized protein YneF (UPF0154 family)
LRFLYCSGTIDFEEFLQMMTAKMGERDSREEIMKAFRLFDDDETGAHSSLLVSSHEHHTQWLLTCLQEQTVLLFLRTYLSHNTMLHVWMCLGYLLLSLLSVGRCISHTLLFLSSLACTHSCNPLLHCVLAGFITFKNLKRVAKELGENLTDEEIQEMIDEADRDGDGQVSEEEFFRIMKKTSLF